MADAIRYYMDKHVPRAVTEGLRRRGVDVMTAREAGLLEAEDARHLAYAMGESRVIDTQDADFRRLHASGHGHGGIVYAPQQTAIATMVRGLMLVHDALTKDDMASHVEFL